MSNDVVFAIANNGIVIFWLLLIVLPRWRGTELLVHSMAVPVVLGLTYLWLTARALLGGELPAGSSFLTLGGVQTMFTSPTAITAGWIHYLVFDLFIGAWESRDAQRRGFPHALLIVCLVVTFLVGPIGLLAYLALRAAMRRGGWSIREGAAG